jgi:hypothetical protein
MCSLQCKWIPLFLSAPQVLSIFALFPHACSEMCHVQCHYLRAYVFIGFCLGRAVGEINSCIVQISLSDGLKYYYFLSESRVLLLPLV